MLMCYNIMPQIYPTKLVRNIIKLMKNIIKLLSAFFLSIYCGTKCNTVQCYNAERRTTHLQYTPTPHPQTSPHPTHKKVQ